MEHHGFHLVARLHHFGGMFHATRPGHFADVNQSFHSRLQFDEGAVIGDVHHSSHDAAVDRILLSNRKPGVRLDLLHAQRDAPFLTVEL